MLEEQLSTFSIHTYTNFAQLHCFKYQKEHLKEKKIVIKDFIKNFSLKQRNEIMLAHWSQDQISLFCAIVHYMENGEKRFQHYVLYSDDLGYDNSSILTY